MFYARNDSGYKTPIEGLRMKTLSYGEKTLLTEFRFQKGSELPLHDHPHEQTGYLVSGAIRLHIGDDTHDVRPGDSWSIPGGVPHGADIIDDTVAIEVFSPIREDYLP